VGLFAIILLPMVYYRYKKEYGWFDEGDKAVSPTDAFVHVDALGAHRQHHGRRSSTDLTGMPASSGYTTDNPLNSAERGMNSEVSMDLTKSNSLGSNSQVSGRSLPRALQRVNRDLRLRFRLVDPDLVTHACRVNLLGSNHPEESRGTEVNINFDMIYLCCLQRQGVEYMI
jgi:hypothetical protein